VKAEAALTLAMPAQPEAPQDDPLWYKDAVIYELHVKAYADGNGDGIGDFLGLAQHLDHVQSLGVNTIWLLPFYPSPLRDDGYDVADYLGVHPQYGTLDDFRAVVAEAHRRGLRVITELVVNHTSDQHPWFQAARKAPKGSPERDFYVWSDDPTLYAGTRIIFTDTEKSNWSWDDVAGQYYWHRFFSHQPDLNFDNPAVRAAVFHFMEFWLDIGVDGFRLDAVPYLIERDGTSNENLRETHDVIKEIRARLDAKYPGRLLLAEANMWPEDVREYFGDGDECHMAYHFPLMPRMYMAIAQEDRHPVVEILAQTPDIPANCQWAVFLRNHDELTLEMVTSKERDYMYRMYATDARSRINLGIRRRLAPLLENDRDRIELMNSLLLSMPGTPVLYYGDEIGMGDNIFLGDRDGVRTPMQWTSDRNGGFSRADPQRLYLPPIQDPIYGFAAVNVEAQSREPSSLLNWTRRLLAVRSSSHAFGRGSFTMLHPGNRKVLAYVREHGDDTILCVANVSRTAQPVELDLGTWKSRVPVEMMGRNAFPPISELPYLLTLPAYGFFWFRLATDALPPQWHSERLTVDDLPVLVLFDGWNSFFRQRVVPWRISMAEKTRAQLEQALLPRFLQRQRWFAGQAPDAAKPPGRVSLVETAMLAGDGGPWLLALADVAGPAGLSEPRGRWFLPLTIVHEEQDEERARGLTAQAVARVRQQATMGVLADALADEPFARALVQAVAAGSTLATEGGTLRFTRGAAFAQVVGDALQAPLPLHRMTTRRNSVSLLGDSLVLKAYRRLQPGISPELEMGRFLTEQARYPHAVALAGSLAFQATDGTEWPLALLQAQVTNQGDAWQFTMGQLARGLEARRNGAVPPPNDSGGLVEHLQGLARRVAELHLALARPTSDPAFAAEPITAADHAHWAAAARDNGLQVLALLARRSPAWPEAVAVLAARVASTLPPRLRACADAVAALAPAGRKTRVHGDLHLAQALLCRDDFLIIDFEGDPQRPLAERRAKHSGLRDLAALLRSIDHAAHTALHQTAMDHTTAPVTTPFSELERLAPLAVQWAQRLRDGFLERYREVAIVGGLYADAAAFTAATPLLDLFELDHTLHALRDALDQRPDPAAAASPQLAALAALAAPA
jgi:maltose alpha-D-glucosyltransferase/alpha-amylase